MTDGACGVVFVDENRFEIGIWVVGVAAAFGVREQRVEQLRAVVALAVVEVACIDGAEVFDDGEEMLLYIVGVTARESGRRHADDEKKGGPKDDVFHEQEVNGSLKSIQMMVVSSR